tara:strand:+ start:1043 stop:1948 length:906 start_codon:yes stop_codon:yes gene_type:complete
MSIYKKSFTAKKGEFYDIKHYSDIIQGETIGLKEDGSILFIFKKNVIPQEHRKLYLNLTRGCAKAKTKNRGAGAGIVDIKKFPPQAVSLCNIRGEELKNKDVLSVYFKYENGEIAKRCQSNMVRCGVAGYFDKTADLPCRMVGWSQRNLEKHKGLIPLCKTISDNFKTMCPSIWEYQRAYGEDNADFLFEGSIFSTLTLNYDFRTACHKDKGDLVNSLSTLTILEDEKDNYDGFYLGLPEYQICFDIRDGDCLIFDAHEYHCNTEYNVKSDKLPIDTMTNKPFAGRLAIVAYLRNGINLCS